MESRQIKKWVIEYFFFYNSKLIWLAWHFVSHFLLETNATFNTSYLNITLSLLLGITNTKTIFLMAYYYITSKSRKSFIFIFIWIHKLIFYDYCPGFYILISNFAVNLKVAIVKVIIRKENLSGKAKFTWEIAKAIDHTNTNCALQLYI